MPTNPYRKLAIERDSLRDERGLSTVEYVILLVLIAAAAVASWQSFGSSILAKITGSNTVIANMDGNVQVGPGTIQTGAGQQSPAGSTSPPTVSARKVAKKVED